MNNKKQNPSQYENVCFKELASPMDKNSDYMNFNLNIEDIIHEQNRESSSIPVNEIANFKKSCTY